MYFKYNPIGSPRLESVTNTSTRYHTGKLRLVPTSKPKTPTSVVGTAIRREHNRKTTPRLAWDSQQARIHFVSRQRVRQLRDRTLQGPGSCIMTSRLRALRFKGIHTQNSDRQAADVTIYSLLCVNSRCFPSSS